MKPLLTIGLPVHQDADGAIFTLQSLRMHHAQAMPRCELLVVDDTPDTQHGSALRGYCAGAGVRYVAVQDCRGPAQNKERIFREAAGEWVACVDCHVLFHPPTIGRLIGELSRRPGSLDMFTGPIVYDNLLTIHTHWSDRWRGGMWGTWALAWRCPCGHVLDARDEPDASGRLAFYPVLGGDELAACPKCKKELPAVLFISHEPRLAQAGLKPAVLGDKPFEIGASGAGLMVMRKRAWPGFNPKLKGFGGEEWYIHEKVRRHGGKVWCVPWLLWWHKFAKPNPQPATFLNSGWWKARNYVIELRELGIPLERLRKHFCDELKYDPGEWADLTANPADPPEWPSAVTSGRVAPPAGYQSAGPAPVAQVTLPAGAGPEACGGCGGPVIQANLPAHLKLEHLYAGARGTPSDINEHCDTLRRLASESETVVEFGVRHGVSTIALLAGQPGCFVTHDLNDFPMREALAARSGRTRFEFRQADSTKCEPIDCDLLFIDTQHNADQLWQELTRHGPRCRRRIALHDTTTFGWVSDAGQANFGLLPAVVRWCRENPEWSVVEEYENNNGLLVLSRDPRDKPPVPPVTARHVFSFAKEIAKFKLSGLPVLDEETVGRRLDVCSICKLRNGDRCTKCGCYLVEAPAGQPGRALLPTMDCPHAKWPPLPEHLKKVGAA